MGGVQQPTVFQGQTLVAAAPRQPLRMAPRVAVPVQMQQHHHHHVQVRAPTISHNYRGNNTQHQGPKPIKATEVKSYLYAWCTQKKLKPDYSYDTIGKSPKIRYKVGCY